MKFIRKSNFFIEENTFQNNVISSRSQCVNQNAIIYKYSYLGSTRRSKSLCKDRQRLNGHEWNYSKTHCPSNYNEDMLNEMPQLVEIFRPIKRCHYLFGVNNYPIFNIFRVMNMLMKHLDSNISVSLHYPGENRTKYPLFVLSARIADSAWIGVINLLTSTRRSFCISFWMPTELL